MPGEEAVARALCQAWSEESEHLRVNSCVLAARVAEEAMACAGILVHVRAVGACCANDEGLVALASGRPTEEWGPDAWTVGASLSAEGMGLPGWAGHLVVETPSSLLDLTAAQFDRPARGIETGGPLVLPWAAMVPADAPTLPPALTVPLPGLGHYIVWGEADNRGFRDAPDWRRNYRDFAGPVIRRMREVLDG